MITQFQLYNENIFIKVMFLLFSIYQMTSLNYFVVFLCIQNMHTRWYHKTLFIKWFTNAMKNKNDYNYFIL